MPTNILVPQSSSESKNNESPLLKDRIGNRVKREKKLIHEINAKFNKKREEVLKKFNIKEASDYLKKERETFDSLFDQLGENVARLEPMKKALRKEIQKNALKKFAGFRELALINAENTTNLQHGLLANFVLGDHLHTPLSDPEIFSSDEYREVAPPFDREDTDANNGLHRFDEDKSFPSAQESLLCTIVRYKDSNVFFHKGSSNKIASNYVAIGCNFTMPQEGMMDVIAVVSLLDSQIQYSASDNFGPSNASFDIENLMFFFVFSEGIVINDSPNYSTFHVQGQSDGDDISDTIAPIVAGEKFTFSFRVGPVQAGKPVTLIAGSQFKVNSTLYNMDIDITGSVLWKVEKFYVRVK